MGLCFGRAVQFLWCFLPERHLPGLKGQLRKQTSKWQKSPSLAQSSVRLGESCGDMWEEVSRPVTYPSCLAVVSSSLQNKAEFQQEDKEMLEGRSGQGLWVRALMEDWKELQSLFFIPCSGRYERHRWEHLEGSGRSQNSVWFYLRTCIPLLPVTFLWVPALLFSVPCASVSAFPGVGAALLHSQAGVWKGEE